MQLCRELDGARTTDLVERIEVAIRSAGAEAAGQSLCRVAEESIGDVVVGRAEVGVVEELAAPGSEPRNNT